MTGREPAFPIVEPEPVTGSWVGAYGLTKLEWFVGMALAGFNDGYQSSEVVAVRAIARAKQVLRLLEKEEAAK